MTAATTSNLGDVAVFVRGINFKPEDVVPVETPGTVACMRTKNIQSELDLSDVWGVTDTFVKRDDQYLQIGDILVSSANSWNLVGKCCWVPELPWRSSFGGFVSVLRADRTKVEPRFLYRWFASDRIQTTVRSFGQQTTNISNLNINRCLKLLFPSFPLSQQRRIVEVLDRADALRVKRRATLAQLDILTQAIFLDLFGDPTTNPKGWPKTALREVASTTSGGTPDRAVAEYFGGNIPWVKSGELHQGLVTSTEECLTERGLDESSAKLMPVGTVLVAMYGATVGAIASLGIEAATNQAVCCIGLSERLDSIFITHLLKRLTPSLLSKRVGGAQPNLSQELIRNLIIPVPPLNNQKDFACRVTAIEKLKTAQRASLARLDTLFTVLQHRAFRGEL